MPTSSQHSLEESAVIIHRSPSGIGAASYRPSGANHDAHEPVAHLTQASWAQRS